MRERKGDEGRKEVERREWRGDEGKEKRKEEEMLKGRRG